MSKNALQAQLLKAGLVNTKQAQKANKQKQHAQKTGQDEQAQLQAELAKTQHEKQLKDQTLNQQKQQLLEEKTLKANIIQMIGQHRIHHTDGDIIYQFIDEKKVKKIYVNQQIFNALVAGSLMIAPFNQSYALLPQALAQRIEDKCIGSILGLQDNQTEQQSQITDEEDPYAAYMIPDDLMW